MIAVLCAEQTSDNTEILLGRGSVLHLPTLRELGSLEDEKMISTPTSEPMFFGGRVATEKCLHMILIWWHTSNCSMFVRSLQLKMVSKRSKMSWKNHNFRRSWSTLLTPGNRYKVLKPAANWTERVLHVHQQSPPHRNSFFGEFLELNNEHYTHIYIHILYVICIYKWVVPSPLPVTVAIDGKWFLTNNNPGGDCYWTGGQPNINVYTLYTIDIFWSHGKHPLKVQKPVFNRFLYIQLFLISISTHCDIIIQ